MADPATIALAVKAAIAAASDKRTWKAIGVLVAAVLTPFILIIVMIMSLLSGTAEHNNSAVDLTFHGGSISSQIPADYSGYIEDMRGSFSELDSAVSDINPQIKSGSIDTIRLKAIFYSLYFGAENLRMDGNDYRVVTPACSARPSCVNPAACRASLIVRPNVFSNSSTISSPPIKFYSG